MEDDRHLLRECRRIVPQVLGRRRWDLVPDLGPFLEDVLAEARRRLTVNRDLSPRKAVEQATVNRYNHLWYAACRAEGTVRQHRAFISLYRYLYAVALRCSGNNAEIADESTQAAVLSVWENLDRVRDPGCFSRWAAMIVINETKKWLRRATMIPEVSESDVVHPAAEDVHDDSILGRTDAAEPSPEEVSVGRSLRATMRKALTRCLRSAQRLAVVWGLFFEEKSVKELADELRTTPDNIYVLRHRALEQLRKCEALLRVLEEIYQH